MFGVVGTFLVICALPAVAVFINYVHDWPTASLFTMASLMTVVSTVVLLVMTGVFASQLRELIRPPALWIADRGWAKSHKPPKTFKP